MFAGDDRGRRAGDLLGHREIEANAGERLVEPGLVDLASVGDTLDACGLARRVIREEKLLVAAPHGHLLSRKRPLRLKHTAYLPLILYPNAPRPSYADQVLSFYRKLRLEPKVGFEVRELQTALGLVAADVGIALVPSSVPRLGRDDVDYFTLNEPEVTSPIIISYRPNDSSPLLAHILKLVDEFEQLAHN